MKRVEAVVLPRCPIEVHAQTEFSVAAVEQREAAFGGEAAAKSVTAIRQVHRAFRVYDCYAAERHLALLGSCYTEPVARLFRRRGRLQGNGGMWSQLQCRNNLRSGTPSFSTGDLMTM